MPPVDDAKGCCGSGSGGGSGGGMQFTRTQSSREIAHCYSRSRTRPLETAC